MLLGLCGKISHLEYNQYFEKVVGGLIERRIKSPLICGLLVRRKMRFIYFDEFGHDGFYKERYDKSFGQSPVFGYSGFSIDADNVAQCMQEFRRIASYYHLKEINRNMEIKGSDAFPLMNRNPKSPRFVKSKHRTSIINKAKRILEVLEENGGKIVYYGMEKYSSYENHKPKQLHLSCARELLRRINSHALRTEKKYLLVFDEHSLHGDRVNMSSTVFKDELRKNVYILDHPYALSSKFHRCIQLADWVSAIFGRIFQYQAEPEVWEENAEYYNKLLPIIDKMSTDYSHFKARQHSLTI